MKAIYLVNQANQVLAVLIGASCVLNSDSKINKDQIRPGLYLCISCINNIL